MSILALPDASLVDKLVQHLLVHPTLNARTRFPTSAQPPHSLGAVPNDPADWCEPNRCWFNVLAAVGAGKGSAVYGWAFWPSDVEEHGHWRDIIVAQHHAVLQDRSGALVDITPHEDTYSGPSILFMGDARVGFDIDTLRQPGLLALDIENALRGTPDMSWRGYNRQRLPKMPGDLFDNFAVGTM